MHWPMITVWENGELKTLQVLVRGQNEILAHGEWGWIPWQCEVAPFKEHLCGLSPFKPIQHAQILAILNKSMTFFSLEERLPKTEETGSLEPDPELLQKTSALLLVWLCV